jgi:hypothetical protein
MSYTSGKFSKHAQKVLKEDIDGIPKNTRLAYDSKAREFLGFCKCVYGNMESYNVCTVTEEKLFAFLFYQAYRNERK